MRYYREDNGNYIYDREKGKAIEIQQEIDHGNHYHAKDENGWHKIDKNDIEEVR